MANQGWQQCFLDFLGYPSTGATLTVGIALICHISHNDQSSDHCSQASMPFGRIHLSKKKKEEVSTSFLNS